MPQETKKDAATASANDAVSLQGLIATRDDEEALLQALENAFDYRGDVTITTSGGDEITGYIFDRRTRAALADSTLRLLTAADDTPRSIPYSEITAVAFTGKDAAHGKSFERWIEKYVQKKLAGEEASIPSDPID